MSKNIRRLLSLFAISLFAAGLATEIADRFFFQNTFALLVTVFIAVLISSIAAGSILVRKDGKNRSRSDSRQRRTARSGKNESAGKDKRARDTRSDRKNRSVKKTSDPLGGQDRRKVETSTDQPRQRRGKSTRQRSSDEPERVAGTIKSYSSRQLYGFISKDDGTDIFFHKSCVGPGFRTQLLKSGTKITFVAKEDDRGHYADDIQLNESN